MKQDAQLTAVEWLVDKILTEADKYNEDGDVIGIELWNAYKGCVDLSKFVEQAKEMEKEKEEQYNNILSMLQETYRRLEHTDVISLRKQIKEVLTFK